jgi:hypothetical protein
MLSLYKAHYFLKPNCVTQALLFISCVKFQVFRFAVLPSSTYLFTVGVEGFYFHLIILKHTPQSVRLLWTKDRPVAETST